MRIDKIEIDGFGKLNNREFVFADGINLIYGENESGKSTLCEFLLSAFYGLPTETKKEVIDIPTRQKYRPWNTEKFGGKVYFTDDNGKKYVIEREFKSTPRSDKSILRDADTWTEIDSGENLGERFFGLSRKAFLKTLYVRSFGADSLKSDDGEILSRLSNLETAGDEDISYSKIINAMEKEIFHLKTKTGRGGKITELEDRLNTLNQEKSLSRMTYAALSEEEKNSENLKNSAEEKEKQVKILEEKYNIATAHEKYLNSKKIAQTQNAIKERIEAVTEKKKTAEEELTNLADEEVINVTAEEISRARALETKKVLTEEKLENLKKQPKRKNNAFILLILSLLGIGIAFWQLILGCLLVALGVVLFFVFDKKNKKTESDDLQSIQNELNEITNELESILKPYGVSVSDELSTLFVNSNGKENKKRELEKTIKEYEKEVETLEKTIPAEENVEYSDDVKNYSGETAEEIRRRINLLKEESGALREKSSQIMVRLARETAEIRDEEEITSEILQVAEELNTLTKKHASLTKAAEWLAQAHNEIKNNFAPRLNEKASEYLKFLTYEKYKDVRATDTFGMNLEDTDGGIREAEYMSRGTYDLLYIALRFAAMNVLTDAKIPPVILDDAFSQLDDKRLSQAIKFLKVMPEFSQIMYFTCHENYKNDIDGINIIKL